MKTEAELVKNIVSHIRQHGHYGKDGTYGYSKSANTIAELVNVLIDNRENEELEFLVAHQLFFERYIDTYSGED